MSKQKFIFFLLKLLCTFTNWFPDNYVHLNVDKKCYMLIVYEHKLIFSSLRFLKKLLLEIKKPLETKYSTYMLIKNINTNGTLFHEYMYYKCF